MGAKQLRSEQPSISDELMNSIYKSIMLEIKGLKMGDGFTSIEKQYSNGISIDVEVDSEGFSYRRIDLINVTVSNSDDNKKYTTELFNMLLNSILELNWIEEEEHEKEYAL